MKSWLIMISLTAVLSGTVLSVLASEEKNKEAAPASDSLASAPSTFGSPAPDAAEVAKEGAIATVTLPASRDKVSSCMSDPAVLEELKKVREALHEKQKELTAKETELKAKESALQDEIKRIETIRDEIAKVDAARKKENEEKVTKLVETFETMNPKAASQLIGSLDESLAVAVMARMSTAKLAKVMNVMEPRRSSRLTELLAGVVRARSVSVDAAETTAGIRKGGEK